MFRKWQTGLTAALVLFAGLAAAIYSPALRAIYVPGRTSDGHYQIEKDCNACHTAFGGVDQQACLRCHADELGETVDAHRPELFNDPRKAWMLEKIDAVRCVSCHSEHMPHVTRVTGVTLPPDFCQPCHAEIATERPSHAGFDPAGCAATGCHRYHDNRALYEDFVTRHLDEPRTRSPAVVPERSLAAFLATTRPPAEPLGQSQQDGPQRGSAAAAMVIQDWAASSHANGGVNCRACHAPGQAAWNDRPGVDGCKSCHELEVRGFLGARHGMRIERGLEPLRAGEARLPMKEKAHDRELGCSSCHGAHQFETKKAAVEACLSCHDDEHSRAYQGSAHEKAWRAELEGRVPAGTGVSCATCHLPRHPLTVGGSARVLVEHNQNDNLRPVDKFVRSVCLSCHGLGFTLDSLADSALAAKNFRGQPVKTVETLELVRRRQAH
jgi:hypothetical protein